MTFVILLPEGARTEDGGMNPPDGLDLAQLLSAAILIAVTCEYAEVVRRREQRRRADRDRLASEAAGLRGLVRVLLGATSAGATAPTKPALRQA
jgi:hypothetical protein